MTGPRIDPSVPRIPTLAEFEAAQYAGGQAASAAITDPTQAKKPVSALSRIPTLDEFNQMQGMSAPAIRALKLPALPVMAARDATGARTGKEAKTGTPLKPFDITSPTTYLNPVLRQVVNPAMDNPLATAAIGLGGAALGPMLGTAAGSLATAAGASEAGIAGATAAGTTLGHMAVAAPLVHTIAVYGFQKAAEMSLSPEDRKRAEEDPDRVSGEAAAVQAAMLGLGPLIHVGLKPRPSIGSGMMEAGARGLKDLGSGFDDFHPGMEIPLREVGRAARLAAATDPAYANKRFAAKIAAEAKRQGPGRNVEPVAGLQSSGDRARLTTTPRGVKGYTPNNPFNELPSTTSRAKVATESPADALGARADDANALTESKQAYLDRRVEEDMADLSRNQPDALRPRRRAGGTTNTFETDEGARVLGAMAQRHGLPEESSPYHPDSPLDAAWKEGHQASSASHPTSETYPEGFSMGGLTDNRIPGAGEIPPTAQGVSGLQQTMPFTVPEGVTDETAALAAALKPSRFRGHTSEELSNALLDAQARVEAAQKAVANTGEGSAEMQRFFNEQGDYTDFAREVGGNPHYAKGPEKALASAKAELAQIEREYTLRGVSGDDLADVVKEAKAVREERLAIQQEETLGNMDDRAASDARMLANQVPPGEPGVKVEGLPQKPRSFRGMSGPDKAIVEGAHGGTFSTPDIAVAYDYSIRYGDTDPRILMLEHDFKNPLTAKNRGDARAILGIERPEGAGGPTGDHALFQQAKAAGYDAVFLTDENAWVDLTPDGPRVVGRHASPDIDTRVQGAVKAWTEQHGVPLDDMTPEQQKAMLDQIARDLVRDLEPQTGSNLTADGEALVTSRMKPIAGTGEVVPRGVALSTERAAVAAGIKEEIGDLPQYRRVDMEDQSQRAVSLVDTNPALAHQIAMGEVAAPDGLIPESVYVAVKIRAIAQADVAAQQDLLNSKLVEEGTTMGQRIRAYREDGTELQEDPIAQMKRTEEARQSGHNVEKITDIEVKSIEKHLAKMDVAWKAFIDGLRC